MPRSRRASSQSSDASMSTDFDSSDSESALYLPPGLRPPSPAAKLAAFSAFLSTPPSFGHTFLALLAFRLLNALLLRTFFQPDEFFQSLEPAWRVAFGDDHAPWITWEWRHQLRSSLHPLLFTAVYSGANWLIRQLHLSSEWQAELLIAAPKAAQAVIAAIGDLYTWKLAYGVFGPQSPNHWAALALTVVSPWQWFCSTRTLSNCLETTLTVVALCLWPWEWSLKADPSDRPDPNPYPTLRPEAKLEFHDDTDKLRNAAVHTKFRMCLPFAALACILRPTNILIWITLATFVLRRSNRERQTMLACEAAIVGSAVLAVSLIADRYLYGFWTFPPLRFLYFNVAQSLAIFYGSNDVHYYVSQGYPLLLTTALPFTFVGLYTALRRPRWFPSSKMRVPVQYQLAYVCLIMPLVLSVISHKEVRFIYPLLPALHVLSASTLVDFFHPAVSGMGPNAVPKRLTLIFLLLVNVVIAFYTSIYHASGTLSVLSYLREQRQIHGSSNMTDLSQPGITAGFLMPCHSTPWRSHLVHPTISAWALSCEPPVGLNSTEKEAYLDEADQFYADPGDYLRKNIAGGLRNFRRRPSYDKHHRTRLSPVQYQSHMPHEWPDYLIFFAQMEPTLSSLLRYSAYSECHRTYNSVWHDDWRRRGDIVVWCVDPDEQQAWSMKRRGRRVEHRDNHYFESIIQSIKEHATGKPKKQPPLGRWKSLFSSSRSWSWPWQLHRRPTVLGIELPSWIFRSEKPKPKPKSSWAIPSREEIVNRFNNWRVYP
ncbi:hypothetical protein BO71DRAFT_382652 [Aspergillus ellipticus CBS 707.79]|uniref:Mannosyltransferase n=1 Tax=Aspergillus ellipticus CBS 707.79 TaxID=1448320 RepID=A0A319D6L6_9EURO|nr:hypothetical protein BO71DRAFT_382652 [Aspergillus ellipticus CBS 707.79]